MKQNIQAQAAKNKQLEEMIRQLKEMMEKNLPAANQSAESEQTGNAADAAPRFFKP